MPSDPTFAYPPLQHHSVTPLDALTAAPILASYLENSLTRPYLHPDAWLSLEGVRHGPKSGPQGSWALHHLRRIEAGLRGEILAVESTEELIERFGEEIVGEATGVGRMPKNELQEAGEEGAEQAEEDTPAKAKKQKQVEKPEHEMTKAEKKKARRAAEKAEIAAARLKGEQVPNFGKKRKRASEIAAQSETTSQSPQPTKAVDINDPSQYTAADKYAEQQKEELADVGDRDPAGVDREDAVKAPVVLKHDAEGDVVVPESKKREGGPSEEEKEARRAAKRARRAEEKEKGNKRVKKEDGDGDVKMEDAAEDVKMEHGESAATPAAKMSRKEKRRIKDEKTKATNGVNGTPATAEKEASKKRVPQTNGTPGEEKKGSKKRAKKARSEKTS